MKKQSLNFLNGILAFGMLCILAGFLLMITFAGDSGILAFHAAPLLFCVAGLVTLYFYMAGSRSAFRLFVALALIADGMFLLLVSNEILPFSVRQGWPLTVILSGAALLAAARTKGRGIFVSYDLPAAALIVLGVNFLLFSSGWVKASFRSVAVILSPFYLILAGVFLVCLFLYRKKNAGMFPSDDKKDDSPGIFSADDGQPGDIL